MLLLVDIFFFFDLLETHVDIADNKSESSSKDRDGEPSILKNFMATSVCLVRRCCMFVSVALTHTTTHRDQEYAQSSSLN